MPATVTLVGTSVQYWSASDAWDPTTQTTSVSTGEKLVTLGVWWDDTGANPTPVPTDSAGTFTRIVGPARSDGLYPTHAQITEQGTPSTGSHTVTPPPVASTGDGWFLLLKLAGVNSCIDSGHFRSAHTYVVPPTVDPATIQACTVTTSGSSAQVGDLVIAIFQIEAYSNPDIDLIGPGSPWTELGRFENVVDNIGYLACYKTVTTAGAQSCSISWTDNNTFTVDAAIAVWGVNVTKATYDSARKGSDYTLSSGDMVATKTGASDQVVFLTYTRTSGKYWDEFLLGSNTNTEYIGLGVGNASASVSTYLGVDTNSVQLYEDVTRGTWNSLYNNGTTTVDTGGPQSAQTHVLVLLTNVDDKMFFMGLQSAGSGTVNWITGDPNTSLSSGGVSFSSVSGAVAPGFDTYYSGGVVTYRTAAQHSATAYMPSGVTQQWDNASGSTTHTKNISYSHVSTLTKSDTISFTLAKTYAHVSTFTKSRLITKLRTFSHVSTSVPKKLLFKFLTYAHVATASPARKLWVLLAKTYSHVSTLTSQERTAIGVSKSYSHVSTEVLTGKVYVPYVPPGPSTWIQRLFRLGDGFN